MFARVMPAPRRFIAKYIPIHSRVRQAVATSSIDIFGYVNTGFAAGNGIHVGAIHIATVVALRILLGNTLTHPTPLSINSCQFFDGPNVISDELRANQLIQR